jgi:hypothetical protein
MFNLEEELKKLPDKPGVYIMHDKHDTIIYVGKAKILKNRARFALNFLVRAVLGACTIACVNKWLAQQGIMLAVGINPVTLLTTGSLGFSGVALLYGILLLKIL